MSVIGIQAPLHHSPDVLKLQCISESPAGLAKVRFQGTNLRVSYAVNLEWGPIIFISKKFPVNTDAAGWGTTLGAWRTASTIWLNLHSSASQEKPHGRGSN